MNNSTFSTLPCIARTAKEEPIAKTTSAKPAPAVAQHGRLWHILHGIKGLFNCLPCFEPASQQQSPGNSPVPLRIMTFNIWRGGDQVDLGMTAKAIQAAKADVVGIQESDGNLRRLAAMLGWPAVNARVSIISKYPLIDPPASDQGHAVHRDDGFTNPYTFIEMQTGRIAAIANVHLPSNAYGPYALRKGASPAEVTSQEKRLRLAGVQPVYEKLLQLEAKGIPVFLTGDFNVPSHLDWTASTAKVHKHIRFPVEWPVSKALMDAGFRDSYREIHPDPCRHPGWTWTSGYPYPRIRPNEIFDRIDFIWAKGNSKTVSSHVVGEGGKHMMDGQHINKDVAIAVAPWPSDHRAVVSEFLIQPAQAPAMLSLDNRLVSCGDNIRLHMFGQDKINLKMALMPAGGDPKKDLLTYVDANNGCDRTSVIFGTSHLKPGAYKAAVLDQDNNELATVNFWIKAKEAACEMRLDKPGDKPSYAYQEPIKISWRYAPGNKWDYIAFFKAGDADISNPLAFCYINAGIAGAITFNKETLDGHTFEPGDYEAKLLDDGGHVLLSTVKFSVEGQKDKPNNINSN